jgi:DNA-3-methyladenine glycosylase II
MALGLPNVWPDGDLALENAMRHVKRLRKRPTRERARRIASRWAPWRSVAARLLWHYYLCERRTRGNEK